MKNKVILIDTGPLVAFLNRRDHHHNWATSHLAMMQPPLLTCEAVFSEACFLLRQEKNGAVNLLELIERKLLTLPFRFEDEFQAIQALMTKYKNRPMSFADACLVRMSEQYAASVVFTLDSDFGVYRKHGRQAIPMISPVVH